jgi:hypothetical protein
MVASFFGNVEKNFAANSEIFCKHCGAISYSAE